MWTGDPIYWTSYCRHYDYATYVQVVHRGIVLIVTTRIHAVYYEGLDFKLGSAFRQIPARTWQNPAIRDRQERNGECKTPEYNNTTLAILVHSSWYLSAGFLHVKKAHTYSK